MDTNPAVVTGSSSLSKFKSSPSIKPKKRNTDPDFILGLGGIFLSFISLAVSRNINIEPNLILGLDDIFIFLFGFAG